MNSMRVCVEDIIELDISVEDRLRLLLREDILSAQELCFLACDFAERARTTTGNTDTRLIGAIDVARRYARGQASLEEVYVAQNAVAAAVADAEADVADADAVFWAAEAAVANAVANAEAAVADADAVFWAARAADEAVWSAQAAAADEDTADAVFLAARFARAAARDAGNASAGLEQLNMVRSVVKLPEKEGEGK